MPTKSAPHLLAVESATRTLTIAISRGEDVRVSRVSTPGHHHAETILPLIDAALEEAGLALADVPAFAVSIGPGSFTSLRIGLSTIKGLAFASTRPVAPVSTLHAIAQSAAMQHLRTPESPTVWLALLDASRGEAYAAAFAPVSSKSGEGGDLSARIALEVVLREGVYTPEELAAAIEKPCALVGEAAALFAPALQSACPHELTVWEGELRASHGVAVLGARSIAAGEGVAASQLVPRYVRRAEAEVKRTKLRFEAGAVGEDDPPSNGFA
jgi:tRNA threonylcarbamoyladenosine biosynthesis protein TsaB